MSNLCGLNIKKTDKHIQRMMESSTLWKREGAQKKDFLANYWAGLVFGEIYFIFTH